VNSKLSAAKMYKPNKFSGNSIRRLLLKSVRSLRTNKFDEAVIYLSEVLSREPDNARGYAILFTTHYKNQQFDKAREVGTKAAELNPRSQYILNNQACLLIGTKQEEKAQELLNELIETFGETAQWLYNLGLSYLNAGEYENAINSFKSALDTEPDHHQSSVQLSALQTKLGLHEDAAETLNLLRLVTTAQPTTSAAYINHSIHFGLQDLSTAKQEISLWGDQYIPKNRRYPQSDLPVKGSPLKIGFIIGHITPISWELMIRPVLEKLESLGHSIDIYWHNKVTPKSKLNIIASRQLSDADFAREVHKKSPDVLIDIGGMNIQTRERALGLQLAKKQFGWLHHPGIYSSDCVSILDENFNEQAFAIKLPNEIQLPNCKKIETDEIGAIGCSEGLSERNIQIWSEILKELPKHNLVLDVINKLIQNTLKKQFLEQGVMPDRLLFTENVLSTEGSILLTNLYKNPIEKSCLAYIQGANIVTLKGDLFPSQQISRLLTQTGNEKYAFETEQAYIEGVIKAANNNDGQALNKGLEASKLLDINGFTEQFVNSFYD